MSDDPTDDYVVPEDFTLHLVYGGANPNILYGTVPYYEGMTNTEWGLACKCCNRISDFRINNAILARRISDNSYHTFDSYFRWSQRNKQFSRVSIQQGTTIFPDSVFGSNGTHSIVFQLTLTKANNDPYNFRINRSGGGFIPNLATLCPTTQAMSGNLISLLTAPATNYGLIASCSASYQDLNGTVVINGPASSFEKITNRIYWTGNI